MIRQNSQQSDCSFDSSVDLRELQLSQSTHSLPDRQRARTASMEQSQMFMLSPGDHQKQKGQANRSPQLAADVFIGFKNGWGHKQIQINQSKLKRAKQFFDDSQNDDSDNYFSMSLFKKAGDADSLENALEPQNKQQEFSMPCFKTVGRGIQVQISQQARQKVHTLFNVVQSTRKSTKFKKTANFMTESLMKTVNVPSKIKTVFVQQKKDKNQARVSKQDKKELFNWEAYEKQLKGSTDKQMRLSNDEQKRKTRSKKNEQNRYLPLMNEYDLLKLSSLNIDRSSEAKLLKQLAVQSKFIIANKFSHIPVQCSIFHCVLCKIGYNLSNFGSEQIYDIMSKSFAKKNINKDLFQALYEQVSFKLLKYQIMWPDILNKRCHPSNIIVEINKKLLQLEKNPESSYLRYCIMNDMVGRKVNVIIKQKQFNQKREIMFLKVSDGWTSVWAVFESHNYLYKYLLDDRKLRVGSKLCISLWNLHPIANILQYCKENSGQTTCIQFFYNGSILLKSNARLGFTPQQFYRPLNRCCTKGGFIPVVEGTIVRLFKGKEKSKRNKSQYGSFSNHFAQILTPDGYTCLIKFILGEENSLVEYFRLYRCYHFYKLKINEERMLSYLMENSKYEEIKTGKISQKQQIYPEPILRLLSQRLINLNQLNNLKTDEVYDFLWDGKQIKLQCGERITAEIQDQKLQSIETLYQQFTLVDKRSAAMIFRRQRYSSQLRRVPKIYETLVI